MNVAQVQATSYTPISSGPDWLTATAKTGSASLDFERIAMRVFDEERAAGGKVVPAARLGFVGLAAEGFFHGRRADDVCVILSGPRTPALMQEVTASASNVSRLDLQCTVWTHGETPHLGVHGYNTLTRHSPSCGRKGQVLLMQAKPKGETLSVNKRSSDEYGRLYDKASEAELGQPRTLWRYEVEFKRHVAARLARSLRDSPSLTSDSRAIVHDWWSRRGLQPFYACESYTDASEAAIERPRRDTLTWFEKSVSVTVARAIKAHGLPQVLEALGLSQLVQPIPSEGADYYEQLFRHLLCGCRWVVTQPTHSERMVFPRCFR